MQLCQSLPAVHEALQSEVSVQVDCCVRRPPQPISTDTHIHLLLYGDDLVHGGTCAEVGELVNEVLEGT